MKHLPISLFKFYQIFYQVIIDDVGHVIKQENNQHVCKFRYPRNLKWKSLPYIQTPQYSVYGEFCDDLYKRDNVRNKNNYIFNPLGNAKILATIKNADIIILDHENLDSETLADFYHFLKCGDSKTDVKLFHFNGREIQILSFKDIEQAMIDWSGHDRFYYNHILNARIILGRAYAHVCREYFKEPDFKTSKRYIQSALYELSYESHWSPDTIQLLYRFLNTTSDFEAKSNRDISSLFDKYTIIQTLKKMQLVKNLDDKFFSYCWSGSGKYPEYLSPKEPIPIQNQIKMLDLSKKDNEYWYRHREGYITDIIGLSLFHQEMNGVYFINKMGKLFFETIGSSLEDIDVLLRWRKPDGRICGPEDIQATDRWLNKNFREVKRKVSGLGRDFPLDERNIDWKIDTNLINPGFKPYKIDGKQSYGKILTFKVEDMMKDEFPYQDVMTILKKHKDNENLNGVKVKHTKERTLIFAGEFYTYRYNTEISFDENLEAEKKEQGLILERISKILPRSIFDQAKSCKYLEELIC